MKSTQKRFNNRRISHAVYERVAPANDTHAALRSPLKDAQHERYCQALLTSSSATEAAIRAGYSPTSARFQASRLLTKRNIQRRLAGLLENASHPSILRRRDVLKNASARAAATITDISDLIGLPWDEFAEKIKCHPSARAIKSVDMGRDYDRAAGEWSASYVKHIDLFDPRGSERLLADLLGWDAPKKLELVNGYRGVIMIPEQVDAPIGLLPTAEDPAGDVLQQAPTRN